MSCVRSPFHSPQLFSGASLFQPWVTQVLYICETLQRHDCPQPKALPFVSVGVTLSLSPIRVPVKRSRSVWSRDGELVVWLCYWWHISHVCCESCSFRNKQTNKHTKINPISHKYKNCNESTAMTTANAEKKKKNVTWRRHVRMVWGALCDRSISYADIVPVSSFDSTLHVSSGLQDVHRRAVQG